MAEVKLFGTKWVRDEVKELPVNLTDKEKIQYGKDLSQHLRDKTMLEGRQKSAKKQFDADIAAEQARADKKSDCITNGYEFREIKCQWVYDWKTDIATCIRLDTKKEVASRPIHHEERQVKIKFDDAQEAEKKKSSLPADEDGVLADSDTAFEDGQVQGEGSGSEASQPN